MKKFFKKVKDFYVKTPDSGCSCLECGRERNEKVSSCEECGSSIRSLSFFIGPNIFDKNKIFMTVFLFFTIMVGSLAEISSISLFSKEALFWFFSAVLQSFAGLIAFMAAVIIFRLQNINNEIYSIVERLREGLNFFKGPDSYTYTTQEVLSNAQDITPEKNVSAVTQARGIQNLYKRHSSLKKSADSIRRDFKKSFINNLVVIIFSLIFLIFTEYIAKYSLDILGVFLVIVFCFNTLWNIKNMLYLIR